MACSMAEYGSPASCSAFVTAKCYHVSNTRKVTRHKMFYFYVLSICFHLIPEPCQDNRSFPADRASQTTKRSNKQERTVRITNLCHSHSCNEDLSGGHLFFVESRPVTRFFDLLSTSCVFAVCVRF